MITHNILLFYEDQNSILITSPDLELKLSRTNLHGPKVLEPLKLSYTFGYECFTLFVCGGHLTCNIRALA